MAITKSFSKDRKKCKVTFTLPAQAAPSAKVVKVVGDFNNWNWNKGVKLSKSAKEFKGALELKPGQRYEFRYLIDNQTWGNDWKADDYIPTPFGVDNSVVIVPESVSPSQAPTGRKAPSIKKKSTGIALTKKKTTGTKAVAKTSTKKTTTKKVATKKTSKAKLNFTVIEGIGPKIAQILVKAGYKTFEDLGKAKIKELRNILEQAGSRYQMHDPSTWAKQSKLAAKDQWTKLNELQASLKGGRK